MMPATTSNSNPRGQRAEEVASWYFRLNGVLHIPGFVLHSERAGEQITDADIMGVRFPFSSEMLREVKMADDRWLSLQTKDGRTLIIIAEVKADLCQVNGPWTDPKKGGMERVIRRIGFLPDSSMMEIAKSLYERLYWDNDSFVVQYVAIGRRSNHDLARRYLNLKQLLWSDIAAFLLERFQSFGRIKGIPSQWPQFGRLFARAVDKEEVSTMDAASKFIANYIETGQSLRAEKEDSIGHGPEMAPGEPTGETTT